MSTADKQTPVTDHGAEREDAYNPDQPRDERGRWGAGGAGPVAAKPPKGGPSGGGGGRRERQAGTTFETKVLHSMNRPTRVGVGDRVKTPIGEGVVTALNGETSVTVEMDEPGRAADPFDLKGQRERALGVEGARRWEEYARRNEKAIKRAEDREGMAGPGRASDMPPEPEGASATGTAVAAAKAELDKARERVIKFVDEADAEDADDQETLQSLVDKFAAAKKAHDKAKEIAGRAADEPATLEADFRKKQKAFSEADDRLHAERMAERRILDGEADAGAARSRERDKATDRLARSLATGPTSPLRGSPASRPKKR